MDFVRMGMNRAQPRFQVNGVMEDGKDLCQFEVAPHVIGIEAARKEGSGVYRKDIIGFAHPDAKLIAAAPELLEALRKAEFRLAKLIALNDEEPGIASPDDAVALEQVRTAIATAEGRSWEAARAVIENAS
jgi:hypothetical protein